MIDDPAPPAVRREVESYLDDYSRSLDLGLAQHFGVEPLNRVAKLSRVDPANAIPTTLPQADPVNEADVQHAA